ncbi:hypothetical protein SAMN05216418_0565 [Microbacterium enclense]|uniref:Uncharacterized protein n=1 Tax=Microbacterium enclense TaxID=993073 RepID=A0A1G6GR37_9MICO|nr:hypothetical protein SAMN05216418_0565 [Microbacterium enclense]
MPNGPTPAAPGRPLRSSMGRDASGLSMVGCATPGTPRGWSKGPVERF